MEALALWLTCAFCGGRFCVDFMWWAAIVADGGEVRECPNCCPAAHEGAPHANLRNVG